MQKKAIANWGNYPVIDATESSFQTVDQLRVQLYRNKASIARGMGRCYGDAALSEHIISTLDCNNFISFDTANGIIDCQAGVTLDNILQVVVPEGWFLPVTPGTRYITVGGAVASDVHGKNHHVDGTFGAHVIDMDVMIGDGSLVTCSSTEHPDLFQATCGGMGLTGIITRVKFALKPVESCYINEKKIKAKNLDEVFDLFQQYKHVTYSVAWIDCLKGGTSFGRSILMLGEHAKKSELPAKLAAAPLQLPKQANLNFPFYLPGFVLNKLSIKAFNEVFYRKQMAKESQSIIPYTPFFYPLDAVQNWNRMYGRRGFVQYQMVFPLSVSKEALIKLLDKIRRKGFGSFLAVLKLFGEQDSLISFPMEGYTLALDFPVKNGLFEFLDELDKLVDEYGGRIYMSKDARMSKELLHKSYPHIDKFWSIVEKYNPDNKLASLQSARLFTHKIKSNQPCQIY